ncbi:MAG: hypothetical protein DCC67_18590 [Planctomycetota bacterium]|nr:MAG: hypothetical protein DCC67_18590 [Planctomycetota bacterium]
MTAASQDVDWQLELASLLERLSAAQRELLSLLATKRQLIVDRDHAALAQLAPREHALAAELQACLDERLQVLASAEEAGLPGNSLHELSAALPRSAAAALHQPIAEARARSQLIRHECLTQWVAVQRTLLHLSQMLEIIATGGRRQPTYAMGRTRESGGALMDQAV